MPRHDDTVPISHMLDHAREAVAMIAGKGPESLAEERMLELALIRLVEIVGGGCGTGEPGRTREIH
jgi:uncharacterized protein with HEPN domain